MPAKRTSTVSRSPVTSARPRATVRVLLPAFSAMAPAGTLSVTVVGSSSRTSVVTEVSPETSV